MEYHLTVEDLMKVYTKRDLATLLILAREEEE